MTTDAEVCEILSRFVADDRRARIDAAVAARLGGLTVIIENLHDPHNGAAVLRSAEAFGLQTVHVVETVERFRFSTDVTQGCEKWLDIERHASFALARARLRSSGFALYGAVPEASGSWEDLDFTRPAAIVIGNEHAGLSREALGGIDRSFAIPMLGMTRSLNLSVAAALALADAARRRRRWLGRPGDLDEAASQRLRARFFTASVRGAAQILARHLAPPDHPA